MEKILNETTSEVDYTILILTYYYAIYVIGIISSCLNLIVVLSSVLILRTGISSRTTYLLLGNISVTDFTVAMTTICAMYPFDPAKPYHLCAIQLAFIVWSSMVSVYTIGLIAIDRFLYIVYGLYYKHWVTTKRTWRCIVCVWIWGVGMSSPPLLGWISDMYDGTNCAFIFVYPRNLIAILIVSGMLPLISTITLYSIILYKALKQSSISANRIMPPPPKRWKAIKVVLFTTLAFIITWGPYFITSLVYVYANDARLIETLQQLLAVPLAILMFSNTLVNPLIYAWWHKGFRNYVKRMFDNWKIRSTGTNDKRISSTKVIDKVSVTTESSCTLTKFTGFTYI